MLVAGLGVGTAVLGGNAANAATNDSSTAASSTASTANTAGTAGIGSTLAPPDPTKSVRSDETLLTGDTATKVTDLALATYPGATVQRVETDSEGAYEAHIVTAAGDRVIVQVGADLTITGTQTGGPAGGGAPGADGAPDV